MDKRGPAFPSTQSGECRANAPRRNHAEYGARRPFARTDSTDWCGDWQERPEPRIDE